MTSITYSPITIQASAQSVPSTPSWFGEVTVIAHFLKSQGVLSAIQERVRFARRRFGRYEVIDFVAVLLGYAISGERTLEAFYEHLLPFATPFMALFERERLPHRSTLSRFLASLEQAAVEALRTRFVEDLLARPLTAEQPGCGIDRKLVGWCSMWMGHGKLPDNEPCRGLLIVPLHNGDCARSALLAISGTSAGRLYGLVRRWCRRIHSSAC